MFKNDDHEIIYITPDMMHKFYNNDNNNYNNNNNNNYNNNMIFHKSIPKQLNIDQTKQIICTVLLCLFFIYILQ